MTEYVAVDWPVAATKTDATPVQLSVSLNAETRSELETRKSWDSAVLSSETLAGLAESGPAAPDVDADWVVELLRVPAPRSQTVPSVKRTDATLHMILGEMNCGRTNACPDPFS